MATAWTFKHVVRYVQQTVAELLGAIILCLDGRTSFAMESCGRKDIIEVHKNYMGN
uniref:Uncharacterized protein n=1 Tax=Anguilla anguilla TaxID=7936 RepID=A0A0E9VWN4_ANGAN